MALLMRIHLGNNKSVCRLRRLEMKKNQHHQRDGFTIVGKYHSRQNISTRKNSISFMNKVIRGTWRTLEISSKTIKERKISTATLWKLYCKIFCV